MNLLEAMNDINLFGHWFSDPSWHSWKTFLKSFFGLPLDDAERSLFAECTGRVQAPTSQAQEAWLVCGRRSGKSHIVALLATFLSTFKNYDAYLAPGEIGTFMIIASDKLQARNIRRYVIGLLENTPLLAPMVLRTTQEVIELSTRVNIEVHACGYRGVRGYTLVGAACDEAAFWANDSGANPSSEVIAALKPGLLSIPNAPLLCLSTPYRKAGIFWETFRRCYGRESPTLVWWRAASRTMNPKLSRTMVQEALEADPTRASAEFLAEFRGDLETFVSQEIVDSCVIPGRYELPRVPNTVYHAFTDPSGGSSDSFTLAVAHQESGRVILDCVRERRPPFSPDDVCHEYAQVLQSYGLGSVQGDRYAGQWPVEGFSRYNINYRASEQSKSDLYLSLLPMLTTGRAELLDNPRLITQLCGLERRTARSGKDSIDHGPGQHDDVCNSAAGALVTANKRTVIDPGEWIFGESYEHDLLASPSELVSDDKFVSLLDF